MLSALLARYNTPQDDNFSGVTGVTRVQASNGNAFDCYPTKSAEVTEVTPCADDPLPVTPVTSRYPTEVTANPLPIQACTPVTRVTPQKQQCPKKSESLRKVGIDFHGADPIRRWLASIGETDREIIGETIDQCAHDPDALEYFTRRATERLQENTDNTALTVRQCDSDDDRLTCDQCANLIARRCQAAKRGEIVASRNFEPIRDLLRRCEGYAPGSADADRRPGRERWPGLTETKGEMMARKLIVSCE